jgi:hypothetical protein
MKQLLCNLCVDLESPNLRVMLVYYRSTRSLRDGLSEVACSFSYASFFSFLLANVSRYLDFG